jgi:hypothetical protein
MRKNGSVCPKISARHSLLDEFEGSGLFGAKFPAHYRLKYPSFAGWVQERRRQRAFPLAAAALTLHMPGGVRLENPGCA